MTSICKLCFGSFTTYQKLLTHERNKHTNNKTVPHYHSLAQPSSEQMSYHIDSFIVLVKKKLGFSRHSIGKKHITLETFPENVFVYLFKDEEEFKYSPAKHKYQCCFEGSAGATRLKQIFRNDHWYYRQNPITNTKGYVLLENYESKYQIKFTWSQTIFLENSKMLGRMTCDFIADAGEFQENDEEQMSNDTISCPKTPTSDSSKE